MASYETLGVKSVESRAGVGLHVRVPRELEVALKPPLRENVFVVLSEKQQQVFAEGKITQALGFILVLCYSSDFYVSKAGAQHR